MESAEREALARRSLEAWNHPDWERRMEPLCHPDGEIVTPAEWPETGTITGWPAIREQFRRLKEPWAEEHVEVVEISHAAGRVLARLRWLGSGAGSGLDLDLAMWCLLSLADQQVLRMEFFLDREKAEQAAAG
jgi:ketosteroid isomerase-like protein